MAGFGFVFSTQAQLFVVFYSFSPVFFIILACFPLFFQINHE